MPRGVRSRNGCAACKSQRIKCNETWPECGRCSRLGLSCSGPSFRVRWSDKHQAPPQGDGQTCKRSTQAKGITQPPQRHQPTLPAGAEITNTDQTSLPAPVISMAPAFDTIQVNSNYIISPSANDNADDNWAGWRIDSLLPESESFDHLYDATIMSVSTPSLLQMAETFSAEAEVANSNPKESLRNDGEALDSSSASSFASEMTHGTLPAIFPSRPTQAPETPQQITATRVERPINDYGTMLVEYYFRDTASILALFDSELNPFRSTVSRIWASSELIYYTLQSMAASFLSNIYPQMSGKAVQFRQRGIDLLMNLNDSAINEEALIALFMIGGTASWFDVNDTGVEYYSLFKRHMRRLTPFSPISPIAHSQTFFNNILAGWEMFLAFVVDGDDDLSQSPQQSSLSAGTNSGTSSIFPVIQVPHPVTGVAPEVHSLLTKVGRLVRSNRQRAMAGQFPTRECAMQLRKDLDEAEELEASLHNLQIPLVSTIVQTGDSRTPTWHLTSLADVYRLVSLLQLYQVFPDTFVARINHQKTRNVETQSSSDVSSLEAKQRLRQFTLRIVDIIRSIPAESGTKDYHPLLIVSLSSGLTLPTMDSLANSRTLEAMEVHQARGFLRSRLQLLAHSLPKKPIRRCIDIVEATWEESDNSDCSKHCQPVYWMDVMIKRNWETFMA